jgi:putative nucleotidyltransferase-like protein
MFPLEFQLLLYSARSQPASGPIKRLVDESAIDWGKLLSLAEQHCVRPLLLQSVKAVCWDAVPPSVRLELERFCKSNAQKNLLLAGELLRLLRSFNENEVPVVAFKGPILAEAVYGDLSLREFCDLDLLIRVQDLTKAEDILLACEYTAQFPDRDYRTAFLSYHGQYAFRRGQGDLWVDLHWQFSPDGVVFPLRATEVWPRLIEETIAGRTVPSLAHDDLALFLAAHGTKEGWRRMLWLSDFAEFLRRYQDLDWIAILERAARSHSSRQLLLAVELAATMLDAPAPAVLLHNARSNSAVQSLARRARAGMLLTAPKGSWEFRFGLDTHDKWVHRLLPIMAFLTTRTVGDHKAMPLPKSLWGLYYLTRPFRLAGQFAKLTFRIRSSD